MSYAPNELEDRVLRFAYESLGSGKYTSVDLSRRFIRDNAGYEESQVEEAITILVSQNFFSSKTTSVKVPVSFGRLAASYHSIKTTRITLSGKALLYLQNRDSTLSKNGILDQGVVDASTPYTTRRKFEEAFGGAKESIKIVDNYIGRKTLDYLLAATAPVQIITSSKKEKNFDVAFGEFKTEFQQSIEIKVVDNVFHGRFMLIDDECYLIDHSIKDFGSKPSAFIRIEEPLIATTYKKLFDNHWK